MNLATKLQIKTLYWGRSSTKENTLIYRLIKKTLRSIKYITSYNVVLNNSVWLLQLHTNVEPFSHAWIPVDSSNFFSTSASDLDSVPSASDLAWPAPSLRLSFVGVEKLGGGGAASPSSESRRGIGNRVWQEFKTRIEDLKPFVFQSSERLQSSVGPFQDAGRPGGRDWKERSSSEHVRRDVAASVTLLFGTFGTLL